MRIRGSVVTGIVVALAMVGVCAAFIRNASPYVTVAQAKESHADGVHLAGDLVKNSIETDPRSGQIKFTLKDQNGEEAPRIVAGRAAGLEEGERPACRASRYSCSGT